MRLNTTCTTVLTFSFEVKVLKSNDIRVITDCFGQIMHRLFHFIAIELNISIFILKPQETETIFTESNGYFLH